ncbi:MAG: carbohydrate kinase family protein [Fimbriimonas sp.]
MVLVFGTVCLDRVMQVARLPEPGGYVPVESEAIYLGGEAANTAFALKNWGVDLELVSNDLGMGADAELLQRLLEEKGFSVPPKGGSRTPVCDIYVTPDGERTMFGRGFSTMEPALDLSSIPFQEGQLFTAEPNMSGVSRQVTREAQRRGMLVYLMDFFRQDDPLEGAFCQCSTDWVGVRGDREANLRWVSEWVDKKGCFAILTDSARGLFCGSPSMKVRHYEAFPAPVMLDSTGAGDTFRAGMLYGLDHGWEIGRCLAFASAAGALECGYLAVTTRTPSVAEIEAHIARNPKVGRQFLDQ